MQNLPQPFIAKAKATLKLNLTWLRGKVSRRTAILLLIALNLVVMMIVVASAFQPQPGPLSISALGKTLQLGDISVHPITINITNKPNTQTPALCLVYVGVEIQQLFGVGKFYLTSGSHIYPVTDILPIGQDTLLGMKQIRALAFHPDDLCQHGPLAGKDLTLLLIHPNGVGTISLAGLGQ